MGMHPSPLTAELVPCTVGDVPERMDAARRQQCTGRISPGVEPGHHVREAWGGHGQKPRAGEVEIESKVLVLELLRGHGSCLVFVAVAGVEKIKERGAVRSELLFSRSGHWLPQYSRTCLGRPHFLGGLFP